MNETLWLTIIIGVFAFFLLGMYLLLRGREGDAELLAGGGPLGDLYDRYQRHQITIDQYLEKRKEIQEQIPENTVETVSRYL